MLVGVAFNFVIGYGPAGVVIALLIAIGMSIGSYVASDRIALTMSRARPADPTEYARFHNIVEGLCIASGLPKPRLYIVRV